MTGSAMVYLDLENLHARAFDAAYGPDRLYGDCSGRHPVLLDLPGVCRCVTSLLAPVRTVRAYANWWWFREYVPDMNRCLAELAHVPNGCGSKNGADIALTLDALQDAGPNSAVTHVVIGTHDSDFSGLAVRLRRAGKVVVGLAVEGVRVNDRLLGACDRFLYYPLAALKKRASRLPAPAPPRGQSRLRNPVVPDRAGGSPRPKPPHGVNGHREPTGNGRPR